jgi:hypothetical protein
LAYSESDGGHYVQLGWNPTDYKANIKYMTTSNMDNAVEITKMRLDNWAAKLKSLTSSIKGDATGYFTKLETKLILISGLSKIRDHILTKGTAINDTELGAFHTSLENWIDNKDVVNPGKFSALGYTVQPDMTTGNAIARADEFRPIPSTNGAYNKEEAFEIVKAGLKLSNGIDPISSADINKWVSRLNVSISMTTPTYYTKTQIDAMFKDGINYLAGLDTVTSFEIDKWMQELVTKKSTVYTTAAGAPIVEAVATNAYSKVNFKTMLVTQLTAILGAQATKTM